MGIRDKPALRYIAALMVIISALVFILTYILTYINPAIIDTINSSYYYNTPPHLLIIATLLVIVVYFFAIIQGLLILLFPSRHIITGVLLIIESLCAIPFSTNLPVDIMSVLPFFIGGTLAILYKPSTAKLTTFPKAARRLISLGAYTTLSALLIDISAKIAGVLFIEHAFQNLLTYQATTPILPYFPFAIIIYVIVAITIFLATLFVSFKLKTKNITQINKYSKFALAMAVVTIVSVIVMTLLFENYGLQFVMSNYATILPALAGGTPNLSGIVTLLALVDFTLLVIGIAFLLLGSLFGLAYSKNIGAIKYVSTNWKPILSLFIIVIIVYAAITLYSNYQVSTDNKMALNSLNAKIQTYGGNLRYMLANKSAFYSAMTTNASPTNYSYLQIEAAYQNLAAMSTPQQNITSALTLVKSATHSGTIKSQINSSSLKGVNKIDWYAHSQIARLAELATFDSLGTFTGTDITGQAQQQIIPQKVSSLQSLYELQSMGINILFIAQVFVSLFDSNYFVSAQANRTHSASANSLGVGLGILPKPDSGTATSTTILDGSLYDTLSLASISNGLLESLYTMPAYGGPGFPKVNNNTYTSRVFYRLALTQYSSYYDAEIFYNHTIEPNIDLFGYLNDTVILNLGNLNLTNPQITVYIDGNKTPSYTRYYNYLVIYNKHLGIGYHKIQVTVDALSLTTNVYVSPTLLNNPVLSHAIYYQNNTNTGFSSLSFSITNPYPSSLNITNLTISSGINPQPSITPSNMSNLIYNWTLYNTTTPTIENATYSKFNFYQKEYNNYTKNNYTIPNFTTYSIPISNQYTIESNDTLNLNYLIPASVLGSLKYYTITFNTNYGKAHIILSATAV